MGQMVSLLQNGLQVTSQCQCPVVEAEERWGALTGIYIRAVPGSFFWGKISPSDRFLSTDCVTSPNDDGPRTIVIQGHIALKLRQGGLCRPLYSRLD